MINSTPKPKAFVLRALKIKQLQLKGYGLEETAAELGVSNRVVSDYWDMVKDISEEDILTPGTVYNMNSRKEGSKNRLPVDYHTEKLYNVEVTQYNGMFEFQEGCCAICGVHQKDLKRRLCVDHDHITGRVRSLLCGTCNSGLGMFKHNPKLLRIAADYVELHNGCDV